MKTVAMPERKKALTCVKQKRDANMDLAERMGAKKWGEVDGVPVWVNVNLYMKIVPGYHQQHHRRIAV